MTSRPGKLLVCTLGLAVILASSADAAAKKMKTAKQIARPAAAGTSAPCRGASLSPCGPIYFEGYYLGEDPDPFIRTMIQRDLGAKFGGPD